MGEGEGSRFLLVTTSSTTAGRQGKLIFPSILRRPWPSLQGKEKFSKVFLNTIATLSYTLILRCSFDESHRQPIFLLGGIPALAELIQVNSLSITIRTTFDSLVRRCSQDDDWGWAMERWDYAICIGSGLIKGQPSDYHPLHPSSPLLILETIDQGNIT